MSLEIYLDTGHSDTGLRELESKPGRKARQIPPPPALTEREKDALRMALDHRIAQRNQGEHFL